MSPHRRATVVLLVLALAGCRRVPDREAARRALAAVPALGEGKRVIWRVWRDGPPWFSCAEILAKIGTAADSAVVRDQLANWRTLVLADVITLRDTSARPVAEPGWCVAHPRDEAALAAHGWRAVTGPSFPTGSARRGWTVEVGTRRLVVDSAPRRLHGDSVRVPYLLTIEPNANGRYVGAARDTLRRIALLRRGGDEWQVLAPAWTDERTR